MPAIHISQIEAEQDLHSLLARVDEQTSFVIVNGSTPVAVLQAAPVRLSLEERVQRLPQRKNAIIDESFAADVQAAVDSHREPLNATLRDD